MITRGEALRFAESWIEAWNSHDLDRILAHYTADVAFSSPLVIRRLGIAHGGIRGRDQLRSYFSVGLSASAQLRFRLLDVAIGPLGLAIIYARHDGRTAVEACTLDAEGRITSADVYYSGDALPPGE